MKLIKNLIQIWKNRSNIFDGIFNRFITREHIELVAKARIDVCTGCPLFDTKGTSCMIPGTTPCCSACGCKLSFKTRALSAECEHPDGPRWIATITQDQEDKIYKRLNYNPDDNI